MSFDESLPDPSPVLDLLIGFRQTKTMFAGVKLGIFDALRQQARPCEQLAAELKLDPTALRRLLDALVGLGFLQRDEDVYSNTAVAETYLTSSSPRRMTGYINFSNRLSWKLWEHLEDAVREGTHRWSQVFGDEKPIFSHFYETEEDKREFLMGMHGFGLISSPHVVSAFDLSGFRKLVDLGGATGHLVMAACQRYPDLTGVVFDLPEVLPLTREIVAATNVADRIEIIGGDFFEDDLPPADLYALGRILHDWSEEKSLKLLRKIHAALPEKGALLISEKCLEPNRDGPTWGQMQDLNMLVCTEGRERTLAEYKDLLHAAGFSEVTGRVTSSPADAILAMK